MSLLPVGKEFSKEKKLYKVQDNEMQLCGNKDVKLMSLLPVGK
jgi:hypothetical protein